MTDYTGQRWGNYRLLRLLGTGGFADVYLGKHIYLGTQATIKILTTKLSEQEIAQFREEARTIYGDVKPENMLLGRKNELLLSDFGIATTSHSTRSLPTQDMSGTIYYMAPEQIRGKPRRASDQYALGIVAYEWLTGTRPFTGTFTEVVAQHVSTAPPSLCESTPAITLAVEQVVLKASPKTQRSGMLQFCYSLRR